MASVVVPGWLGRMRGTMAGAGSRVSTLDGGSSSKHSTSSNSNRVHRSRACSFARDQHALRFALYVLIFAFVNAVLVDCPATFCASSPSGDAAEQAESA